MKRKVNRSGRGPRVRVSAKEILDLIEKVDKIPKYPTLTTSDGLSRAEVEFVCSMINLKLARWLKYSLS